MLAQGALVLLITDGLDRDDLGILRVEVERLHKSCRRLIWLNPLLRYEGFKPEAGGVRTILPHIDDFRPVHNIASLMDIAAALARLRRPSRVQHRAEPGLLSWSPLESFVAGRDARTERSTNFMRDLPGLSGIKWDSEGRAAAGLDRVGVDGAAQARRFLRAV